MRVVVFAVPILPGKSEAWRRFMQELLGSHRDECEEAQRLLDITKNRVYLQQMPQREVVVVCLETDDPTQVLSRLVASASPFDRWFKQQVRELHGLDLNLPLLEVSSELVLEWQAS